MNRKIKRIVVSAFLLSWLLIPVLADEGRATGNKKNLDPDALSLERRLLTMTFIGLSNEYKLAVDKPTQEVLLEHICTLQFVYFLQTKKLGQESDEYLDLLVGQSVDTLWDDEKYIARTADPKRRLSEQEKVFAPLRIRGLPLIESAESYKQLIGEFKKFLMQKRHQFVQARNGMEE